MKKLISGAAVLLLLVLSAGAAEPERIWDAQAGALDLARVEEAAGTDMEGTQISPDLRLDDGLHRILSSGTRLLPDVFRRALRSAVVLLMLVLICSAGGSLYEWSGTGVNTARIAGALGVTAVSIGDIHALAGMGSETIAQLETFSKALLPVLAAASAAGGSVSASAARQVATVLFSDVLLTVISRVLLPMAYAYAALCLACAATGNRGLKKVASFLKWSSVAALSALTAIFVGYLNVSGAVAGTVDASLLKAMKVTVSGTVPIVGGILADATDAVLAGAGIIKNAVGVFGLLAVISLCALPFLELGVHYLVYKATAALASTAADGTLADLIDGIGDAFGLILGMTGACALLLLISLVSTITAVTP